MRRLDSNGNYQLRGRNNEVITHEVNVHVGLAPLKEDNVFVDDDELCLNFSGPTSILENTSSPKTLYGEDLLESEDGQWHLAGDLKVMEISEYGFKINVNRKYTQGIVSAVTRERVLGMSTADRAALVLKYVDWYLLSAEDKRITEEARERIRLRTVTYARRAGLYDDFQAVCRLLAPPLSRTLEP